MPWLFFVSSTIAYSILIPYNIIIVSIWINYALTLLTPSYVLKQQSSPDSKSLYCSKCKNHKPKRAHHCSECQKCTTRMVCCEITQGPSLCMGRKLCWTSQPSPFHPISYIGYISRHILTLPHRLSNDLNHGLQFEIKGYYNV